jgi:uncharacterized membrane protein
MTDHTPTSPATFDSRTVTASAIKVLTLGWKLSFTLIILGLVIAIVRDEPLASELGTFGHVFDELITGHSNGFLGLGILMMILSPIVASATIALGFFRIGDRRYGMITSAVFIVLVVSIALSLL